MTRVMARVLRCFRSGGEEVGVPAAAGGFDRVAVLGVHDHQPSNLRISRSAASKLLERQVAELVTPSAAGSS